MGQIQFHTYALFRKKLTTRRHHKVKKFNLFFTFSYVIASGGFRVGGPEARPKGGPLTTSSYSANRDKHF